MVWKTCFVVVAVAADSVAGAVELVLKRKQ